MLKKLEANRREQLSEGFTTEGLGVRRKNILRSFLLCL